MTTIIDIEKTNAHIVGGGIAGLDDQGRRPGR